MRIKEVVAIYPDYKYLGPSWRTHLWQILVRIETDLGIVGLGYGGGGNAAVEIVNGHFRELLIGRVINNTEDIKSLWDMLYRESIPYGRKGIAIMGLSGIDIALWDLLGKAESMPVYELIGSMTKQRVRAYATGPDTNWYRDLGFTAHKISHRWNGKDSDYDSAFELASKARNYLGADGLIMIDNYMTWTATVAIDMAKILSNLNIYWFEDVLTPDDLVELSQIRTAIKPILLAGGEHEFTHHGFGLIANQGSYDLWQPDITWCGGITAGIQIIDLASKYEIPVVPHRGGEIWGLHLIVATNCEDLGEVLPGSRGQPQDVIWKDDREFENGFLTLPTTPGFGVKFNENLL